MRPVNSAAAICSLSAALAATAPDARAEPAPADDVVPIERIILYRSGVGAFERQGRIDGDANVALRFETEQINDILKSMVLLDLDGGRVGAVSYGSKEPLQRRLDSFRINISDDPSIANLLKQVRGVEVELDTAEGPMRGTVLGVEKRTVPLPGDQDGAIVEPFVNLVTSAGIRSVAITAIRSFTFADDELQDELARALATLADHRADRVKTVELSFHGAPGERRRVVVSYVHEMPVWKTSYRLVLPDPVSGGRPTIQGWAIIENTTDNDWNDVELSLASGRPVGFVMDLYQPLFAPRPVVPVPLLAALAPQVYKAATNVAVSRAAGRIAAGEALAFAKPAARDDESGLQQTRGMVEFSADDLANYAPAAAATAGDVGEQFMYSLDAPVTLERQRSAMLPVLSAPIDGRRVSIYSYAVNAEYPMRGVQLTNDTGLHLMPGPIAVYDAAAYAGDAQIPHTSRAQTRLLSYAVDLDVRVDREPDFTTRITAVRIVDGAVEQTVKSEIRTDYAIQNQDEKRPRTILVEHRRNIAYELVEPRSADETLPDLYRFEVEAKPGAAEKLTVREERIERQTMAVTSFNLDNLLSLTRSGRMSEEVAEAIRTAAAMQAGIARLERERAALSREGDQIASDQDRIRDNMQSINERTELYTRYVRKLSDQETRLEQIEKRRAELAADIERERRRLADDLRGLDVD